MCPFRGCLGNNRLQIWSNSSLCETPFLHKLINTLLFWFWWSTTALRLLHTALLHKRSGICLKFFVCFIPKNIHSDIHLSLHENLISANSSSNESLVSLCYRCNHDACCNLDWISNYRYNDVPIIAINFKIHWPFNQ